MAGRSQLEATLPYVVERIRNGGESTWSNGVGDFSMAASHQFLSETDKRPSLIGSLGYQAASGRNTSYEQGPLVALGGGFPSLQASASATKRVDPLVCFGSLSATRFRARDKGAFHVKSSNIYGLRFGTALATAPARSMRAAFSLSLRDKTRIDQGTDPRRLLAAQQEAHAAESAAAKAQALRDAVTLRDVWSEYVAERSPLWSEHHVAAHQKIIQAGGAPRSRSPKLTASGPLATLADLKLVELTTERIEAWAKAEAIARPSSGRLAMRLLKACLNWCSVHPKYSGILTANPTKSTKAREVLGRPKVKHDVLQREQLRAWFGAVRQIGNPVISAYLQTLLLTGARREEVARLRWGDVDFKWNSIRLNDKVEDQRIIPLTPYVASLLSGLPRINDWVFSSQRGEAGRLAEPRIAHNQALAVAGLPPMTVHGLRRSFASLSEWTETPAGIAAQIQGHAPQGVREQNYIRRPLDLLRMWHVRIEGWILDQAGVEFTRMPA